MKRMYLLFAILLTTGCAELQQVVNQIPQTTENISNSEIASALQQTLTFGIEKQVSKLTVKDGFYKNTLVKILLPEDLMKLDDGLRKVGLGNLADEGLKALNRAAEDAVKEATPIFINAVKGITFNDAKSILLGDDNAATKYLIAQTETELYNAFKPQIQASFSNVGADIIWSNLITKYNNLPFTNDVNTDLTDYVTNEALKGVFTMIALEEKAIRTKMGSRTTTLLQKVFALQD